MRRKLNSLVNGVYPTLQEAIIGAAGQCVTFKNMHTWMLFIVVLVIVGACQIVLSIHHDCGAAKYNPIAHLVQMYTLVNLIPKILKSAKRTRHLRKIQTTCPEYFTEDDFEWLQKYVCHSLGEELLEVVSKLVMDTSGNAKSEHPSGQV